jgi:hypothetical protein
MDQAVQSVDRHETGSTFPADEVVWGFVVRPGFDELDDPFYHRGTTQHAYLEGNDLVSLCGFRPPRSGPRGRRRSRLGLPTAGSHPMCGMCARKVVAPRPRIGVPIRPGRPAIAVPVNGRPVVRTMTVAAPAAVMARGPVTGSPRPPGQAGPGPQGQPGSPWVSGVVPGHDRGLLSRGVHADLES